MNDHHTSGRRFRDLQPFAAVAEALRFFSRLPAPARRTGLSAASIPDEIAAASPVAGAVIGAAAALVLVACLAVRLPPLAAAVFATAAAAALSGALHLDGLADVVDGFGGGRDRERKLAIMRDSRLGAFGGAALALALLAQAALTAGLAAELRPLGAAAALIVAATLARPLAFLPTLLLEPARDDGLGRGARPSRKTVALGFALACLAALALAGPVGALLAILLSALAAGAVSVLARRQIGGYTGDVCGAAAALAEIAALAGLSIAAAH